MNQMQHDFVGSPVAKQDYGPVLGTPFKVFLSGSGIHEFAKEDATEIVDLPGLIAAIIRSRVLHPRKLTVDDLKYIRSALRLKSKAVAEALEFTAEHYSRCEGGTKVMSPEKERFYRMWAYLTSFQGSRVVFDALRAGGNDKGKMDSASPEDAKKMVKAFSSIFLEMKLDTVFEAGDKLEFSFCRGPRQHCGNSGEPKGKWLGEEDRNAA